MPTKKQPFSFEKFSEIYHTVPRCCVDVIVRDEQRGILLTKRDINPWKGWWHLPGGTLYYGESLAQAAKRIAKEETGLNVSLDYVVGAMEFLPHATLASEDWHMVSIGVFTHVVAGVATGSWQAEELDYFWLLPEKTIPVHAHFLEDHNLLNRKNSDGSEPEVNYWGGNLT